LIPANLCRTRPNSILASATAAEFFSADRSSRASSSLFSCIALQGARACFHPPDGAVEIGHAELSRKPACICLPFPVGRTAPAFTWLRSTAPSRSLQPCVRHLSVHRSDGTRCSHHQASTRAAITFVGRSHAARQRQALARPRRETADPRICPGFTGMIAQRNRRSSKCGARASAARRFKSQPDGKRSAIRGSPRTAAQCRPRRAISHAKIDFDINQDIAAKRQIDSNRSLCTTSTSDS